MRVVILHGWGHSAAVWAPVVERLAKQHAVEAWDLPGFGNEPLVSDAWGIAEYAAWVNEKLVGAQDVVLVGHSFGGRIASLLASRHPNWLRALVLIGAPCIYRPSMVTRAKSFVAHLVKPIVPAGIRRRFLSEEFCDAERSGIGRVFRHAVMNDQTATLPNIAVPTLLLWGENDGAAPVALAREIHALISGSTLVILPNIGHNVHMNNPNLTYGAIQRFLETL